MGRKTLPISTAACLPYLLIIAVVFPKLRTAKTVVRKMSDYPVTGKMVKGPKHCRNLNSSLFTHCERD